MFEKQGRPWKYSFDTSAYIDSWRRYYPKDLFPKIWEFIEEKLNAGVIVSTDLVKDEIYKQEDGLSDLIRNYEDIFLIPNEKEQKCARLLINNKKFVKWSKNSGHDADPFVVALAKIHNLNVVSYENPRSIKNNIPAACHELGITHFTFLQFLRNENFRDD